MHRLSLDHITIADARPPQLIEIAYATGCAGVCTFLRSMPILPAMPEFDLTHDVALRRATRTALRACGVTVDMVYPFTLAGRTVVADFAPVLEAAADLDATLANVLCYDRDPTRRIERLIELRDLADGYGLQLAIEFYPPSQVATFADALELVGGLGPRAGITVDLLHLQRSGEMPALRDALSDPRVRLAQLSDGPQVIEEEALEWEAGRERLLPGEGAFDCRGFVDALAPGIPLSVEVPRDSAIAMGTSVLERARAAVEAASKVLAGTIPKSI